MVATLVSWFCNWLNTNQLISLSSDHLLATYLIAFQKINTQLSSVFKGLLLLICATHAVLDIVVDDKVDIYFCEAKVCS